jgi:hypothetical protein
MATPRKSVSTKHPEGGTGLEQRWLRNPAVIGPIIVAIIGGIAAISVAFIQRTDPKPKLSEPTKIEQHTHGSGSPVVDKTGGNVTIQQQGSGPQGPAAA